jgi:hypothetical protein
MSPRAPGRGSTLRLRWDLIGALFLLWDIDHTVGDHTGQRCMRKEPGLEADVTSPAADQGAALRVRVNVVPQLVMVPFRVLSF